MSTRIIDTDKDAKPGPHRIHYLEWSGVSYNKDGKMNVRKTVVVKDERHEHPEIYD